jgi:hypothetical protein
MMELFACCLSRLQRWSPGAGGAGEHPDGGGNGGGPPAGMPAPLSALQLVAGLEGAGLPQPFWSLAAFSRLQVGLLLGT